MSGGGSPDFQDVDYTPSGITSHYNHRINVFLPATPQPSSGYPVLVFFNYSGWAATSRATAITEFTGLQYLMLKSGWAIVEASLTISSQLLVSGGATYVANKGVFTPPNTNIAGIKIWYNFGASIGYFCAEKDALWVVQYLRSESKQYRIDPNRIAVLGNSAGGNMALWAAFCVDVGGMPGFHGHSSRANFCLARFSPASWYAALDQTFATSASYAAHMPDSSDVTYATPATQLSQVSAADQKAASPIEMAWDTTMAWQPDPVAGFDWLETRQKQCRVNNRKVPLYLYGATDDGLADAYDFQDTSATDFNATGLPAGTVAHNHNIWNCLAFAYEAREAGMRFAPFGEYSRLAISKSDYDNVAANSPAPTDILTATPAKIITHTTGAYDDPVIIDQADWLNTVAGLRS